MKIQPVIKWSGSKRSQSEKIISYFPKEIDIYYEPFVGGGSVIRQLLESDINVNKYICSDINKDLISLWNKIKFNYNYLGLEYEKMWIELNWNSDVNRKKEYFYFIRNRFNQYHKPEDFLFLSRTCINGLIRYNKKGEFNSAFHLTRNGIIPETMSKILEDWSNLLYVRNVEFVCMSYENIKSNQSDFLYLDPPYAATKGQYYGILDYKIFWKWLSTQEGKYSLSFDGKTDKESYIYNVPKNLYVKHEMLLSGNSSFRRTTGKTKDTIVYESLYLNYSEK